MNEFTVPAYLQDARQLLSESGFACTGRWYHGTASGLIPSIQAHGLHGSGDLELLTRQFKTLGTIGHDISDHKDPLFITQSKELAYFWACEKAHTRSVYLKTNEQPVVFELNLPEDLQQQVTTDAGGAALVLEPGNLYLLWLGELYDACGISKPDIDPLRGDRMDYLNKLGLAYLNAPVAPEHLLLLQPG